MGLIFTLLARLQVRFARADFRKAQWLDERSLAAAANMEARLACANRLIDRARASRT